MVWKVKKKLGEGFYLLRLKKKNKPLQNNWETTSLLLWKLWVTMLIERGENQEFRSNLMETKTAAGYLQKKKRKKKNSCRLASVDRGFQQPYWVFCTRDAAHCSADQARTRDQLSTSQTWFSMPIQLQFDPDSTLNLMLATKHVQSLNLPTKKPNSNIIWYRKFFISLFYAMQFQFPMWEKVTKIYVMGNWEENLELLFSILRALDFMLVLSPTISHIWHLLM